MMIDLDAELLAAMALARNPKVAEVPHAFSRAVPWGFARVGYWGEDRRQYEPQEDGEMAFVLPVVEDGELIDLAAINPQTQHLATRHGFGFALGADAIDKAKHGGCQLHLVERPLAWLRHQQRAAAEARRFIIACHRSLAGEKAPDIDTSLPADFAYLFRLADVARQLEDVREIVCEGIDRASRLAFAKRVAAMLPPSQRKRVVLP